ncbi:MAG: protein-glutamate O-methyltransferase [Rhodospirillaceae bacterium]|jgi:chemotaxis protein methyltransferase CheR|nr:protein-glutamate O-methyltransferase [Rhodospirillaceae bacterium]MBT5753065.1 protein-glutamate O-methyltransferase [Rhodospirillaceae bacterium]
MKSEDFQFISKMLKAASGLILTEEKSYLLESRLMPVARKHSLPDLDALVAELKSGLKKELAEEVVEAMTTNESFFFRDVKPFDQFRDIVLPNLLASRASTKKIRIWCAACSSGQEPYSLAMILNEEKAKMPGWSYEILATDISLEIIDKAKTGYYSQFEVQRGLPIQLLMKYFNQEGDKWKIDPILAKNINFKFFNLLNDPSIHGKFDVVFCRNVLIYFEQETKKEVLEKIAKQIPGDGVLYLGGAETVIGITDKFQPVAGQRGLYNLTGQENLAKTAS